MCEITVIMPTYNESKGELDKSIDSILNQTYTNFSLIIIDDNPNNKELHNYLQDKSSFDSRIHLLFNKVNIGQARSRNKGIKYAQSPLIALLDADDIAVKNRLKSQLNFMKQHRLDFVFPNGKFIINGALQGENMFYNQDILDQRLLKYIFSHYYNFSIHSGWLLKSDIYKKLDGYRQIKSAEDFDFLLRAFVYHYRIGYQSDVLIYKRHRINGISNSNILEQFLSGFILQKYARKFNYKNVLPMNLYNRFMVKHMVKSSIINFNIFLRLGRYLKCHFNFIIGIRFILFLIKSTESRACVINLLINKYLKRKIYGMIVNHKGN